MSKGRGRKGCTGIRIQSKGNNSGKGFVNKRTHIPKQPTPCSRKNQSLQPSWPK